MNGNGQFSCVCPIGYGGHLCQGDMIYQKITSVLFFTLSITYAILYIVITVSIDKK